MENQSLLNLVGLILPPFIDIINRRIKDSDTRRVVSILICVVCGVLVNLINANGNYAGLSWSGIILGFFTTITSVLGAAQLTYKGLPGTNLNYEDSDLRSDAGLNAKTN